MTELTYNPYLLHKYKAFDMVGLQTNDILILANNNFAVMEEKYIKMVKFMIKK